MNKGQRHEWLVYALNRPLSWAVLELAGRLGKAVRVPGVGHVISDAVIARRVLTDTDCFDSHSPGSLGVLVTQTLGPRALLNMDGPEHAALKRRLTGVFSPRYIDALLTGATDCLVVELQENLRAGRTVDFVAFMRDFASSMACEMIGVEVAPARARETWAEMFALATAFTAFAALGKPRLAGRELERARAVAARLTAHVRSGYDREGGREGSLTRQMRAAGFTFEEIQGIVVITMVGAVELITYGLPRVLALLLDNGLLPRLQERPERIEAAVDEGFRLVTPSNVVLRAVTRDCEIDGHRFRAGERAFVVFHNIMRRREYYADPHRFELERVPDPRCRRLVFGAGPHACLGAGLAIAEAQRVLASLLPLEGRLEIVRRGYNHGKTYPGYSALGLRLRPDGFSSNAAR